MSESCVKRAGTLARYDYDVVICGSSFAGLSCASELSGSGARVLLLDRHEIGEHRTSACATPTSWLEAMDLTCSIRQTFGCILLHTTHGTITFELPWTFSTFDYSELCTKLFERCDAAFETASVRKRLPEGVLTDRGEFTAPLVVDCTGWRSVLRSHGPQPPDAPLTRALEISPSGTGNAMEFWIDESLAPAGCGWNFPAGDELRVGIASYDPRYHVRGPLRELSERLKLPDTGYHGNWIPHKLNRGVENDTFFCGDSAGHCLPLTAEGIRTAFYFGIACGRELRRVIEGRENTETALRRYDIFCRRHENVFTWLLLTQRLVPKLPPPLLRILLRKLSRRSFTRWSLNRYMQIAVPVKQNEALCTAPTDRSRSHRGGPGLMQA